MIVMINERNGHKARFKSYQKLFNHIDNTQRSKRHNFQKPIDDWVFSRHSYRRLLAFHEFVNRQKRENKEITGGKGSKFDVLEISHERYKKTIMIPITSDFNIESCLEDWCQRYCQVNGYRLIEIHNDNGVLHVKKNQPFSRNSEIICNDKDEKISDIAE